MLGVKVVPSINNVVTLKVETLKLWNFYLT